MSSIHKDNFLSVFFMSLGIFSAKRFIAVLPKEKLVNE